MTRICLLIALISIFTGCGQSGPLYIPADPSEVREPPPAENQADEEDEESENNS